MDEKPSKSSVLYGGSCACGRITYESSTQPEDFSCCHCITCRKLSGAPYIPFVAANSKEVLFFDNISALKYEGLPVDSIGGIEIGRRSKEADRAFCHDCHSQLAMRYNKQQARISLCVGTIDEDSISKQEVKEGLRPTEHIFISQKCSWSQPSRDGIPCYDRFPGNFEQDLKAWAGKEG